MISAISIAITRVSLGVAACAADIAMASGKIAVSVAKRSRFDIIGPPLFKKADIGSLSCRSAIHPGARFRASGGAHGQPVRACLKSAQEFGILDKTRPEATAYAPFRLLPAADPRHTCAR